MKPVDLAAELGISPKRVRGWLRANHPRPDELKGSNWELTEDLVSSVRSAFAQTPTEKLHWAGFIRWALAFQKLANLDDGEYPYKLRIASDIRALKDAINESDSSWTAGVRRALGGRNNLIYLKNKIKLIEWSEKDPESSRSALAPLLDEGVPVETAVGAFADNAPPSVISGRGTKTTFASVMLMGRDPTRFPPFATANAGKAYNLVGYPAPANESDEAGIYENFLDFLDTFILEGGKVGLVVKDRLEAQGLLWAIVSYPPPKDWPEAERQALRGFRGEIEVGELHNLVAEFVAATGYPNEADEATKRYREEMAAGLTPDALTAPDANLLRRLGGPAYGSPGPQSPFMALTSVETSIDRVGRTLSHLLYGEGDIAARIDQALEDPRFKTPGLEEAILTKCLAVARPDRWLPVYVAKGPRGKLAMLALLGLSSTNDGLSRGEQAIETNDLLYQTLEPHFPDDPWGMMSFLWWLIRRQEPGPDKSVNSLANELLIEPGYLATMQRLLLDKKQIILHGPPGTGKTYVANKLATFIAGKTTAVERVQFHPSYAYEDFVEGWRPTLTDGVAGFRLKDGPLKRIAQAAADDKATTYVLVIDEINRGNLAKVFGELYFLLEYRGVEISLMYSEAVFTLPDNLLIIGTMNTADRSIALVDAALRRRFYFFPFFPNQPPLDDLLARWLKLNKPGLEWVADVVDRANLLLGERHGAIGPSHFMRKDLDEEWVSLIWAHSVLPHVEEQLFGEDDRLADFALTKLRRSVALDVGRFPDDPRNPV